MLESHRADRKGDQTMKQNNEILKFLENTTHTQANYQFIVLRELINSNVEAVEIDDLLIALNKANAHKITWSSTPVFRVLTKKKFIKIKSKCAICNFEITPGFKIKAIAQIERILKIIPK